jgi:hypothetical protein
MIRRVAADGQLSLTEGFCPAVSNVPQAVT